MSVITWWPNGGGSGAVTFAAVRAALQVADTPVSFNLQSLQSVGDVNGLELRAGVGESTIVIGDTLTGAPAGINRLAVGKTALNTVAAATDNCIAIGNFSQQLNATGERCISLGHNTLAAMTAGSDNIALGDSALAALTVGFGNVAVGSNALGSQTSSAGSVAIGGNAGALSDANDNVLVGYGASSVSTSAAQVVAVGSFALGSLTTGGNNTALGAQAGGLVDVGTNNVFVGDFAGNTVTGSGNIMLGSAAVSPDPTLDNRLCIGNAIFADMTLTGTGPHVKIGGSGSLVGLTEVLKLEQLGANSVPVASLNTTGANGASAFLYCGSGDPSGVVNAPAGSLYFLVSDAASALYVNRSVGSGNSWSLVTAVP